jgi:cell division transport system permease protein
MRLRLVLTEMVIGLRRNITLTLAVIITVAVSLVLVGAALMLNRQVSHFKGYWYDKIQVTVQLCSNTDQAAPCNNHAVTDVQKRQINAEIVSLPQVERVFFESKEQAYANAKVQFKDIPALLNSLTPDTLPESFRVKLKDPQKADILISALSGQPGVEGVQDERKLLAPLFRVLSVFRTIAAATAAGVLLAGIALIVNTIRIAVFSRRREIGIMRLVGASNLYIELPFLLEGAIAGLIGGLLAFGGVAFIESFLVHGQLVKAVAFTKGPAVTWGDVTGIGITIVLLGVVMSTIVAFLTLTFSRATRV